MKKAVVLGATGMAGHVIALFLEKKGYEVYRMSRSIMPSAKNARIDATDFTSLIQWLDLVQPDVVINAIGLLQQESEQHPDRAILINAYLPHMLSKHFKEKNTKLIHLSTDCVFSGDRGAYEENALRDGLTMYDRTKALGELDNEKDLTFRMSIIGPDVTAGGTGLFNWFMKQQGIIKGFSQVVWNGITTIELSKAIDAAINQNLSGLYHLTPSISITKFDLLLLIQNKFNKNNIIIEPYADYKINKTLVNTRTDFKFTLLAYPEMIEEMSLWIREHRELYHYA